MAPGLPTAMDRPHFIGIGGAGMSGIAKILTQRGAKVAGSDAKESATAEALRALGATVHIGHAAEHLADDASCVVVSSAIRPDNPELTRAAELGIPVVHRSDALAALMDGLRPIAVAGTHGKTTTTSMLAVSLTALGLEPSYAIGGDLDAPGSNALHGEGGRLRRRGRRIGPQLPQVRARGRHRPQRRAGPPRQLRLHGRDLRVLRDVRGPGSPTAAPSSCRRTTRAPGS